MPLREPAKRIQTGFYAATHGYAPAIIFSKENTTPGVRARGCLELDCNVSHPVLQSLGVPTTLDNWLDASLAPSHPAHALEAAAKERSGGDGGDWWQRWKTMSLTPTWNMDKLLRGEHLGARAIPSLFYVATKTERFLQPGEVDGGAGVGSGSGSSGGGGRGGGRNLRREFRAEHLVNCTREPVFIRFVCTDHMMGDFLRFAEEHLSYSSFPSPSSSSSSSLYSSPPPAPKKEVADTEKLLSELRLEVAGRQTTALSGQNYHHAKARSGIMSEEHRRYINEVLYPSDMAIYEHFCASSRSSQQQQQEEARTLTGAGSR